jgi:hypothetical protein
MFKQSSPENRQTQLLVNTIGAVAILVAKFLIAQPTYSGHRVAPEDVVVQFSGTGVTAEMPTPGSADGVDVRNVALHCDGQSLIIDNPNRIVPTVVDPTHLPTLEYLNPGLKLVPLCPDKLLPPNEQQIRHQIVASGAASFSVPSKP